MYVHVQTFTQMRKHNMCQNAGTRFFAMQLKLVTGQSAREYGPQRALPTFAFAPSACPFVSVVGLLQVRSHHGHQQADGRRRCGRGRCPLGPVFACAFSCGSYGIVTITASSPSIHASSEVSLGGVVTALVGSSHLLLFHPGDQLMVARQLYGRRYRYSPHFVSNMLWLDNAQIEARIYIQALLYM